MTEHLAGLGERPVEHGIERHPERPTVERNAGEQHSEICQILGPPAAAAAARAHTSRRSWSSVLPSESRARWTSWEAADADAAGGR